MVFWVLLAACVIAFIVAGTNATLDTLVAYALTAVFIYFAAAVGGGRDHREYEVLIEMAREIPLNRPDLLLLGRIDPLFTLLVKGVSVFTDSAYAVFLIVAILGFGTKLWLSAYFPRYRALFMAVYAILLAPWLEFAAIRAAIAVGFIGIAFMALPLRNRLTALVAACFAHISAIMPAGVAIAIRDYPSRRKALALMILAGLGAIGLSQVFLLIPRAYTMRENAGSIYSLFFPVVAGIISLYAFARTDEERADGGPSVQRMALAGTVILGFSAGITLFFVTVAYRMLQFSLFLSAVAVCVMLARHPSARYRARLVRTLSALILLTAWMDYRTGIWHSMIPS